ncbi:hypothetical protein D3C75_1083980 [compost metagenome]
MIHQYLGQALVRRLFGDLHVPGGEVLEDRLEDVVDGQRAGLVWQFTAKRGRQADRAIIDRLVAVEAVLGLGGHPYRVLRWRHETAATDFHVQYAMGRILQRAPRVPMGRGKAMGIEIGIAEVHRGG